MYTSGSDGLWYILGRADDVIKISGHRIGSVEIEAAIAVHPAVADAMAIGVPDQLKGQSIIAHVVLKKKFENCTRNREGANVLKREIMQCIENGIGKFACPKEINFVDDLPDSYRQNCQTDNCRKRQARIIAFP